MPSVSTMRANRFVRHVALAAAYAIVNAHLAHRTERFVVKSRHAQRRAQLFVELAQVLQVRGQRGNLQPFVGQQKLLIARVPQLRELALQHNPGRDARPTSSPSWEAESWPCIRPAG